MIEKLTPEQEAKFPEYVKRGKEIGFCTKPINKERAIEAVKEMYKWGEIDPPKKFVFCKSPITAITTINILNKINDSDEEVKKEDLPKIVDQYVEENKDKKIDYIYSNIYGQHEIYWLIFYKYFQKECGLVKETEKINGLYKVAKECGWLYAYKEICFICEKPQELHLDENDKLHNEDGYAFKYSDGFGACFYHGIQVPDWVILEKEKITPEKIFAEGNKEIQRCMMELYGLDRLLEVEGDLIHSDDWGDLYHTKSIKDSFGKPLSFLKVVNFSPNEQPILTKAEIDKITLQIQEEVGYNGHMRHGDVVIVSEKNKNTLTREQAEEKIKTFKTRMNQEIELLWRRKNVKGEISYKNYFLQINPEIKTAYEAWQSTFKRMTSVDFLPIVAT